MSRNSLKEEEIDNQMLISTTSHPIIQFTKCRMVAARIIDEIIKKMISKLEEGGEIEFSHKIKLSHNKGIMNIEAEEAVLGVEETTAVTTTVKEIIIIRIQDPTIMEGRIIIITKATMEVGTSKKNQLTRKGQKVKMEREITTNIWGEEATEGEEAIEEGVDIITTLMTGAKTTEIGIIITTEMPNRKNNLKSLLKR
jgi:hypothetical protein